MKPHSANNDGLRDGSDYWKLWRIYFAPIRGRKGTATKRGDSSYDSKDERNEMGDFHDNSETPRRSMRKKGGEKGGSIRNYVRCDIVDDEFEAQAVKFVKTRWPRSLKREERLDILLLRVHMRKEHSRRCRKMGPSRKAPASNFSTTVACIFRRKRALVQSVWAEYAKEKRMTVKAMPCNLQSKIYRQRGANIKDDSLPYKRFHP